jgi:serine/threonine protein kinase
MPLTEIQLPYLSSRITFKDLHSNHKLLTDAEIAAVKNRLQNEPDGRYRKDFFNRSEVPNHHYGIIKCENNYYAVYKGTRHHQDITTSVSGNIKVKLAQNLDTGEWVRLKIYTAPKMDQIFREYRYLKKIGHAIGPIQTRQTREREIKINDKIVKRKLLTNFMLIKLIPGTDLNEYVQREHLYISTTRCLQIAIGILQQIKSIHDQNRLLCNIAISNFIYDDSRNIVTISDYQTIIAMNEQRQASQGICGADLYVAPEHLSQYESKDSSAEYIYDERSESYSAGIALKILMKIPVKEISHLNNPTNKPYYEIGTDKVFYREHGAIVKFLDTMTCKNPEHRCTIDEALEFFTEYSQKLEPVSYSKVCIIDVSDFEQLVLSCKKNKDGFLSIFDRLMREMDEVCFVTHFPDDHERRLNYMGKAKIQAAFNKMGVIFNPRILVTPDVNSLAEVRKLHEQSKDPRSMRTYVYFDLSKFSVQDNFLSSEDSHSHKHQNGIHPVVNGHPLANGNGNGNGHHLMANGHHDAHERALGDVAEPRSIVPVLEPRTRAKVKTEIVNAYLKERDTSVLTIDCCKSEHEHLDELAECTSLISLDHFNIHIAMVRNEITLVNEQLVAISTKRQTPFNIQRSKGLTYRHDQLNEFLLQTTELFLRKKLTYVIALNGLNYLQKKWNYDDQIPKGIISQFFTPTLSQKKIIAAVLQPPTQVSHARR